MQVAIHSQKLDACPTSDSVSSVEANLAANVDAFTEGIHPGYEPNALDGLKLSLRVAKEKGIRLIVNGGALNPQGLARAIADYVRGPKQLRLPYPPILIIYSNV